LPWPCPAFRGAYFGRVARSGPVAPFREARVVVAFGLMACSQQSGPPGRASLRRRGSIHLTTMLAILSCSALSTANARFQARFSMSAPHPMITAFCRKAPQNRVLWPRAAILWHRLGGRSDPDCRRTLGGNRGKSTPEAGKFGERWEGLSEPQLVGLVRWRPGR
jgi:hypothetical protein